MDPPPEYGVEKGLLTKTLVADVQIPQVNPKIIGRYICLQI
jgi:hypothetical protein